MRFLVPRRDLVPGDAAERAYMTGLEEIPWQTRVQWTDDGLVVRRAETDSGSFHIPWNVAGAGEMMLATTSLMERTRPYHLPVELARGSVNRLRGQLAAWQGIGLETPAELDAKIKSAIGHLAVAAISQSDPTTSSEAAQQAIDAAHQATQVLVAAYVEQTRATRQRQNVKSQKMLGVSLGRSPLKESIQRDIVAGFNSAVIPLPWREVEPREGKYDWTLPDRQVEWCRLNNLRSFAGPILQLDRASLPDWLYLWEGDFENLASLIAGQIKATVLRYRGKVALWICSAGLNTAEAMSLSEEQRLRLAVMSVEATREADPRAAVVLSIDQPWGEYLARQAHDLSPLHFADALARSEVGLTGFCLDVRFGYYPLGTQPRDLLDFSRQLDRWSCLGLPLVVNLVAPSDSQPDPQARSTAAVVGAGAAPPPSPARQAAWVAELLPLLLAKPMVQAVLWNQLRDSQPHEFAHGGLYDRDQQPKPALAELQAVRKRHLG